MPRGLKFSLAEGLVYNYFHQVFEIPKPAIGYTKADPITIELFFI